MTKTHPILIEGEWTQDQAEDTIRPKNPATGQAIGDAYPISPLGTLKRMAIQADKAAETLNHIDPERIARFLDTHASLIDERRDAIADMAHEETGLARSPRLVETEMDRTVDQLRQAAQCVRSRTWMSATIDTKNNLRSMYEPLGGAALTIGPNNFPLAYNGIAGGDYAAAIAARNPVIAKAHPLHPGTTRLLASCAHDASIATDLPTGSVQMFYHCTPEHGLELIRMPKVSAVGFTGSQRAGLAMKEAADETGTPIYLELSSINPMFLLPGAVDERGDAIASMIADSMTAAAGQQCTAPGLIILRDDNAGDTLVSALRSKLEEITPQTMLSHDGAKSLHDAITKNMEHGATCLLGGDLIDSDAALHEHTLLQTEAAHFIDSHEDLQTEMFGAAALVVQCESDEQFVQVAKLLEGNLTGTIHHESSDRDLCATLARVLRNRVGRLIHNAVPTGVSVSPATVHGGPYPATGHPGFTAVGVPTSIHRFAARRCYDRVEPWALPPELRDENPTGSMLRYVNGVWTQENA